MKEVLTDEEFEKIRNDVIVDETKNVKFSLKIFDLFK